MEQTQSAFGPTESILDDYDQPRVSYIGFVPRLGAFFIDGVILTIATFLFAFLQPFLHQVVFLITTTIIYYLYNLVLEYRYGATVGKMALRIRIVNSDLQNLTMTNVILRNIISLGLLAVNMGMDLFDYYHPSGIDEVGGFRSMGDLFSSQQFMLIMIYAIIVFVVYIIELIFLLTDTKHRALHDRIGKTYVVKKI